MQVPSIILFLVFIVLAVVLLPVAFQIGFLSDFAGNGSGGAFIIVPLTMLCLLVWGGYVIHKSQVSARRQQIKNQLIEQGILAPDDTETIIINNLSQRGPMSIDDLVEMTGIDKETALIAVRLLMHEGRVTQKMENGVGILTLTLE